MESAFNSKFRAFTKNENIRTFHMKSPGEWINFLEVELHFKQ